MIIQFGCGGKAKPNYINVDLDKTQNADVILDMNKFPYPFKNNSADKIICEMTLEHIYYPSKAIDEFHRIIKPNGTVEIKVPHFSHAYSLFADIHIRQFNIGYFWRRKQDYTDMWENDYRKNKQRWKDDEQRGKWKYAKVELIFPKGFLTLFSLPFQLIFGKNKIMQGIYEHFLSNFYRACEIKILYQNKDETENKK